jgi:hypothetical protein
MSNDTFRAQQPTGSIFSLRMIVVVLGIIFSCTFYFGLWGSVNDGISGTSGTTPYWDFNNLWVGSKLALEGQVKTLFDVELYRTEMDRLLALDVPNQEWSYPPNMLLIGAPLAVFPIPVAYTMWTIGAIILMYFALKPFQLTLMARLAITLSPAIFMSALFGQNGTLISVLLLSALVLLPSRPVVAGILIGILTIKPQFGLLLPFILIASQNWKAFGSATITAIALFLISGLSFGFETWALFISETQPMMRDIMEAPYRQGYQNNAVTVFITMRALGAELPLAYGVQIIASLACLVYAIRLWRTNKTIAHELRVALTLLLVLLATPYGYTYDMVGISAAIGIFCAFYRKMWLIPIFGFAWLFPLFNHFIVIGTNFNPGSLVLLAVLGTMYYYYRFGSMIDRPVKTV